MKLSTRCRYGALAMVEIARHHSMGPIKRKVIAKNQGISTHYLENILIVLKSCNLIKTVRGANGGFSLGTDPVNITMFEIVTALEGSIAPTQSIDSSEDCRNFGSCVTASFWQELHDVHVKTLKGTNLQTFLDMECKHYANDYCI